MRKELIDKVNDFMRSSGLHQDGAIYPRRYFDDMIIEHTLAAQQSTYELDMLQSSSAKD